MEIYLVGGAVRDKLLNRPVREKDWVVVGGDPAALESQGYKKVGKNFPVFLHPETSEEYALARTETKTGPGYHGFDVYAGQDVSLEDDLLRRDLTINAIAEDSAGNLTDPYHGQADINARVLRHVSAAFREDPLRVLRVARFAARFHAETEILVIDRPLGQCWPTASDCLPKILGSIRGNTVICCRDPHLIVIEWLRSLNCKRKKYFAKPSKH